MKVDFVKEIHDGHSIEIGDSTWEDGRGSLST